MTLQPTSSAPIAVPCDDGALLMITPPEGWLMAPASPPARLSLLDPSAAGPFRANINIVAQNLGKMTVEEFMTLNRLQMKAMGDNLVVERDEPIGSGKGGHLFEFRAYGGPVSLRGRQLILLHAGTAYLVTAMAALNQFEAYRSRFETSLASVCVSISKAL
jgi:hypothetical protein